MSQDTFSQAISDVEISPEQGDFIELIADEICHEHKMPTWLALGAGHVGLPSIPVTIRMLTCLDEILFPCFRSSPCTCQSTADRVVHSNLRWLWESLTEQVARAIPFRWLGDFARSRGVAPCEDVQAETARIVKAFIGQIPAIRSKLMSDVEAAYRGDPAAKSFAEVILSYPGLRAITVHRVAHELHSLDVPLIPRIMSEYVHSSTGIDIHPGARIGHSFFIDHGTGTVIGETSEIGDHVKLYQGVTLGARSFPIDDNGVLVKGIKRHPTIGNDVVIYSGATILGGDVVIGDHSIVGGNVWLTESVDPYSFVVQEHHQMVRVTTRSQDDVP